MAERSPETQVLAFLWRRRRHMPLSLDTIRRNARSMMPERDEDLPEVLERLREAGWLAWADEGWSFTEAGRLVGREALRTSASVGFSDKYARIAGSEANHRYSRAVYGWDAHSMNMMGPEQRQRLLALTGLQEGQRFLDLGCGSGAITHWLAASTGAEGVGVDLAESAIELAARLDGPLSFQAQDMDELDLPAAAFDVVVAVDTLYFPDDLAATLEQVFHSLRAGGKLVAAYSHYRGPSGSDDDLQLPNTPLGRALPADVSVTVEEVTALGHASWRRQLEALAQLEQAFVDEGLRDIWVGRQREAEALCEVYDDGRARRYLVSAVKPG